MTVRNVDLEDNIFISGGYLHSEFSLAHYYCFLSVKDDIKVTVKCLGMFVFIVGPLVCIIFFLALKFLATVIF